MNDLEFWQRHLLWLWEEIFDMEGYETDDYVGTQAALFI